MSNVWAHDRMSQARLAGYSWGEIDNHIGGKKLAANAAGYSDAEVRAFLGYKDPLPLLEMLNGRNDAAASE